MKRTAGVHDRRVTSVLTPTGGFIAGFTHSLNPYMGCAFGEAGCGAYCYVAESPIGLYAGIPWGTWVEVKTTRTSCSGGNWRACPISATSACS